MQNFERIALPESVETFVAFVGWPRSGNSFLGQVLNAHPNAMIANEGQIYDYAEQDPTRDGVFSYLTHLDGKFAKRGYRKSHAAGDQNLHLPGAFQGAWDDLTVIGNSKAGGTSRTIAETPEKFDALIAALDLEPRFIFLTRHPRDIVGSIVKRTGASPDDAVNQFRIMAAQAETAKSYLTERHQIHSLAYESFVANPTGVLSDMLDFIGLPRSPELEQAVIRATFKAPDRPGDRYPELAQFDGEIADLIETTPCLARYAA